MSIQLNDDWRVVRDEEDCVYSLQQLEGDGWITRAKAGYRNQLLRRIGDWCGSVSGESPEGNSAIALATRGSF